MGHRQSKLETICRLHELSADDTDNNLSLDYLLRKLTDDINEAATAAIPIVLQNHPRRHYIEGFVVRGESPGCRLISTASMPGA